MGTGLDYGFGAGQSPNFLSLTIKSASFLGEDITSHRKHETSRGHPSINYDRRLRSLTNDKNFAADEYVELTSVYEPKVFVCTKSNLPVALEVSKSLDSLKVSAKNEMVNLIRKIKSRIRKAVLFAFQWIIILDEDGRSSAESSVISFGHLCSTKAPDAPKITVEPDILAYMPRTSGTSGRSKIAMHTHRTLTAGVLMQS